MHPTLAEVRRATRALASPARSKAVARYFKTAAGEYAEGDRFLGLTMPQTRALARRFRDLPPADAARLLRSRWHEERMLALVLLVQRHGRAEPAEQRELARLYLANMDHVNNWDLIDTSAPHLLGPHLTRAQLDRLARSKDVWRRRAAVLATQHRIRQGRHGDTLRLARLLLRDEHDLIHKAVGWMLREVHGRDPRAAEAFLHRHAPAMPRTMLRYAIEKMPPARRQRYLGAGRHAG